MKTDLVLGMAGSGGDGIVFAGETLISLAARSGYNAVLTKSFGSQIRGGESSCRFRIAIAPVSNPGGTLDLAVALNWEDFLQFGAELPVGGATTVIYECQTGVLPTKLPLGGVTPAEALAVPMAAMAREHAGTEKAKNGVVLGLLAAWLGLEREGLLSQIRRKLGKKGPEVIAGNERAFAAGVAYALEHPLKRERTLATPVRIGPKSLADGNDICAAAALFAGCTFFSGYPITPSSEIMQFLGREIWKHHGAMLQAEDEIAGVGAAVGASFAGKKAMTATSGPGMSLKTEMLGLATIAELPLVCINVQRGGPSTGIPTKGEQSDLFQAVFSAHGDAPRPVLAPVSARDTFGMTVEAFNIAERYQTPVIVLSDQEIAQRKEAFDPIDTSSFVIEERRTPSEADLQDYKRFRLTETGISPISHPGMEHGNYLASGIEHNERGAPTASGQVHQTMNDKRFRKLAPLRQRTDLFEHHGPDDAPFALVAWGNVAGVATEALDIAAAKGVHAKLLVPKLLFPVAEEVYREFFSSVTRGLVVEQSFQGQLYRLVRMYVEVPKGVHSLTRSAANPFSPEELADALLHMSLESQRSLVAEREPQLG